jgi:hypothetical protein
LSRLLPSIKKHLPGTLVLLLFLLVRCGDGEGEEYVYSFPAEDRFKYKEGNMLLYACSDGRTDTFLVESAWYDTLVEDYPCGGLYGPSKTCTYRSSECYILLRQLNNFWLTVLEGGMGIPDKADSTSSYGLRFHGSFDSDNEASDCSSLASQDSIFHYGYIAGYCKEGYEEYDFNGHTFSKAFMKEGIYGEYPEEPEVHFRIYWNLRYGIFRYEDLRSDPPLTWDLER